MEEKPDHDVTMSEVASELGIVTMGIYKHVRTKEDLLAGMAERVFSELDLWAGKYRDFFVRRPYANHLIAWHDELSESFMNWCGDLVEMLHEYRVKKKDLERTLAWLIRQLHAYVMLEQGTTMNHLGDHGRLVEGFDITRLSRDKQRLLKPLLPRLAKHTNDDFYRFHIEATLKMLKQVAGAAGKNEGRSR
jgi:AcrR family transcriptional regulator